MLNLRMYDVYPILSPPLLFVTKLMSTEYSSVLYLRKNSWPDARNARRCCCIVRLRVCWSCCRQVAIFSKPRWSVPMLKFNVAREFITRANLTVSIPSLAFHWCLCKRSQEMCGFKSMVGNVFINCISPAFHCMDTPTA